MAAEAGLTGVSIGGASSWGDYDGDGDPDLVVTGPDGDRNPTTTIYRNKGGGEFSSIDAELVDVGYNSSVSWGDYDGDGDLDLVLSGEEKSGNEVTMIYRNDGRDSFTALEAGLRGVSGGIGGKGDVSWGDYDGDGDLDLVVAGQDDSFNETTTIYRNDGGGTFTPIGAGLTGIDAGTASWGDYDGDGDRDLLLVGTSDGAYVAKIYRNEGDGEFTPIGAGLKEMNKSSASWGDYDGDGDLDLVVTGRVDINRMAKIYRNDGGGTFTPVGSELKGVARGDVAWGDYNGDGNLDLVITGIGESGYATTIYRNEGGGTFEAIGADVQAAGLYPSVSWEDYDGDGDLDLSLIGGGPSDPAARIYESTDTRPVSPSGLSASGGSGKISLNWESNTENITTAGSYEVHRSTTSGFMPGSETLVATVNHTGGGESYVDDGSGRLAAPANGTTYHYKLIAVDERGVESRSSSEVSATSSGPSLATTTLQPRNGAPGTTVRLYGDGFDSTPSNNTVTFGGVEAPVKEVLRDGSSLRVEVPGGVSGPVPVEVAVGGVSAVASTRFSALNRGSYLFEATDSGLAGVSGGSSSWGDYDRDGDLDLVVTGYDGNKPTTKIYKNEGGEFTAIGAGLTGLSSSSSSWGDYDSDGDLDLVITGANDAGNGIAKIYRNDGGGTFTPIGANLTDMYDSSSSWGDYDGDGDLDLVLTGLSKAGGFTLPTAKIYRNDGGGRFEAIGADLSGVGGSSSSSSWGDYDGDGDLDLVVTGRASATKIYRNDGSGKFTEIDAGLAEGFVSSSWGDYDSDGDLDLVLTGDRNTTVYENAGEGEFTAIDAGLTGVGSGSAAWGDYDGDGAPDLLVTGYDGTDRIAKIYSNEGGGTFAETGADLTGVYESSSSWGDYDGDGDLDLMVIGEDGNSDQIAKIYENVENTPPTISGLSDQLVRTDDRRPLGFSYTIGDDDTKFTQLKLSATSGNEALVPESGLRTAPAVTSDPSNALLNVDPADKKTGTATITITVEDEGGQTTSSDFTLRVLPEMVSASISRNFTADSGTGDGYRLVALPGQAGRLIGKSVSGEAGIEWQAYRDDGSQNNFLRKYDGSEEFTFKAGNGFWLTSTAQWTEKDDFSAVSLQDGAAEITLRDGWNVISNPLDRDVSWSAVEAENVDTGNGETLQPIWGFDGTFGQASTFVSAAEGKAYYFLNDKGLQTLKIPYPSSSKAAPSKESGSDSSAVMLSVTAQAEGAPGSTVRIGLREDEKSGQAVAAPPGRFEKTSLRIESEKKTSGRTSTFMAVRRALEGNGETFGLQLTSQAEGAVNLSAENLQSVESKSVVLLHPSEKRTYDLRENASIQVAPKEGSAELKLAIGTEGYVEKKKGEVLPDEVRITSYPNPVGEQGTIEYILPEQQEVSLRLYDVMGRAIATFEQGQKEAGRHAVRLDATRLASGVYFARLQAEGETVTQKITVVR